MYCIHCGNKIENKQGLLNKLRGDIPFNQNPATASYRAKFVEDIQEKLFYKNPQTALDDLQYFGYDNFKSLFEGTIGAGRKAYAVLKNLGSEPIQQTEAMIEMAKAYANTIAPKAHGLVKAKKYQINYLLLGKEQYGSILIMYVELIMFLLTIFRNGHKLLYV